jgi:hypothetical protein
MPDSAEVLSEAEINGTIPYLRHILGSASPVLDPAFFLASVNRSCWKPCVVTVRRGQRLVGTFYAKERTIAHIPTGLIYADETLGGMVAAAEDEHDAVLQAALECLLTRPGVRGLRLAIPAAAFDRRLFRRVASSLGVELEIAASQASHHARIPLPSSYEAFLSGLGSTSRRNFRYYRRRSEQVGSRFVPVLPIEESRRVARQLAPRCSIPSRPDQLIRVLNMVSTVPHPLLMGLQDRGGEWLSVAGGICHGSSAILIFQLNSDRDHRGDSLSTVLRSYLIESLIERGISELAFWGGTAPPLARYAESVSRVQVYLDTPGVAWRAVRLLAGSAAKSFPGRAAALAEWLVPSGDANTI